MLRNRIRYAPEVVARAVLELEDARLLRVEPERTSGGATVCLAPGARLETEAGTGPWTGRGAGPDAGSDAASDVTIDGSGGGDGSDKSDGNGAEPGRPWQRLVLRRLSDRALPGVPTPLSLLTTVDGNGFWDWRQEFEQALLTAAEREGLIRRRLTPGEAIALVCLLTGAAATGAGWLVAALLRPSPGFGAALATALFGFILFSATAGRLAHWRLSEAGRSAVRRAEAASAGADDAARARESAIRAGLLPLPKDHVWSSHGGSWRVVGLGSRFGDTRRLPRQVREALPDRRVLACQVVKRWYVPGGRERDPAHCCAFDDGASSFTWTFDVPERVWADLAVGEVVLVDFSPRRHRLYEVGRPSGPTL